MKSGLAAAIAAASLAFGVTPASAYSTLYAFGDSLSDAGNLYNLLGVPPAPYYKGHFSNGLTWVEDLSVKLGLGTLTPSSTGGNDWAYGGAQTGPQIPGVKPAPAVSLDQEVAGYLGLHPAADPKALYTLSIGANDIFQAFAAIEKGDIAFGDLTKVVDKAVSNTITEVATLAKAGMKTLMFYEAPNVGLTPLFNGQPTLVKDAAALAALSFDEGVLAGLAPLEAKGLKVYDLPIFAQLNDIVKHPSKYGFTDVTHKCFDEAANTLCAPTVNEQNKYLFWDIVHPTAAGHTLTANLAYDRLTAPEPSTWAMALIGFAGLGLLVRRDRRSAAA